MPFTAENINSYKRKLQRRINSFSGKFMSDSKWLKLFKILSVTDVIKKCSINSIWDNTNELHIPNEEDFSDVFTETGIKDVIIGGPTTFKEIRSIEFPAKWKSGNTSQKQDLIEIRKVIEASGLYEIEVDINKLIIYGYR